MADDPVGVGRGVATLARDFVEIGGRVESVPTGVDPDKSLVIEVGEGTGEVEAGRVGSPIPEEEGNLATIRAADTTQRKKI